MGIQMIKYTTGNIFYAPAEAIVNTVNLKGCMGAGLAFQFKQRYPANNIAYMKACIGVQISIGKVLVFQLEEGLLFGNAIKYIINFPTKDDWRNPSKLEYISLGLESLKQEIVDKGIKSIAIPPLGCGLGGLQWQEVKALIEHSLGDMSDVEIIVYKPVTA